MVKIYLHGLLGKFFKKEFLINARSAEEALRALDANTSDRFMKKLNSLTLNGHYYSIVIDGEVVEDSNSFKRKSSKIKNIHFVPAIGGAGFSLIFQIILIVAQVAYMIYLYKREPKSTPTQNIAIGGEVQQSDGMGRSYIFSNDVNTVAQGVGIPIGYGRMMANSRVISTNIKNYLTFEVFNVQAAVAPNYVVFDDYLTE